MKKCPFCAEEIQDQAIKCKHCGESLNKRAQGKWYLKTSFIVMAFLCVGPLALVLIWIHPQIKRKNKAIISIAVLIISFFTGLILVNSLRHIYEYYRLLLP